MSDKVYKASLSRSQNRKGYCVIFQHPLCPNNNGKGGRRIRRGLGTDNEEEAKAMVNQLNEILSNNLYWPLSAKEHVNAKFSPKVVAAFYDDIERKAEDPWNTRNEIIPLPTPSNGYTRILLVGATGAGKTTLLRQLIGSDPKNDRFPSISTAKTTIFDTEVIFAPLLYKCVVSFLPRDSVRSLTEECVIAAIMEDIEGSLDYTVARKLLEHAEQRFRLSYLLGNIPQTSSENEDEEQDSTTEENINDFDITVNNDERTHMQERLQYFLSQIKIIAHESYNEMLNEPGLEHQGNSNDDHEAFLELLEDKLYENEKVQLLVDNILSEVEDKFSLLTEGHCEQDISEWTSRWTYETDDRREFIRNVNRFSSNYAPNFGKLLAPLIQGLRVSGPFHPSWLDSHEEEFRFVFMDGEGLGHTPASASTLSTSITRRYDIADVILLVDNATQPLQASAHAVLRSTSSSGNLSKLAIAFTHFDEVKGDNLPNISAKKNHVIASLDNAITAIDADMGSNIKRMFSRTLESKIFFLSKIQERLSENARGTRSELTKIIRLLQNAIKPEEVVKVIPIYDLANLILCVRSATDEFHSTWLALLGLSYKPGIERAHWSKVKALSRRFTNQGDEYGNLKPRADFIEMLQERLANFIDNPRKWEPMEPPRDAQDAAVSKVKQEVHSRLHTLTRDRLINKHLNDWIEAYGYRGIGSTSLRARDIRTIYEMAVPIPTERPMPEASEFLDILRDLFRKSAESAGARIIG